MPLGIVSDEEFEAELQKTEVTKESIKNIERGRPEESKEVPDIIRQVIGESAIEDGNKLTQETLGKYLGISNSSISAYKKGAHSTVSYHKPDKDLKNHISNVKERITKKASRLTLRALSNITDDKLFLSKAVELSQIARASSSIIKDMTDSESGGLIQNNQVIIFRPRMKEEDDYDVIDVTE